MREWIRRRSRRAKARLVFYPLLVGGVATGLALATVMPGRSHAGPLPPLSSAERAASDALRADVEALAGQAPAGIGERNLARSATMARAADVVERAFVAAGRAPRRLPFDVDGASVHNLEVEVAGRARPDEVVVVGAHYDTAEDAPGADDNASGLAVLLALARAFVPDGGASSPARTLRLVAFANEEPPHFQRETMGSLHYARACKARGDRVVAMLSLESLGYYRDEEGSQKYPPIVAMLYPSRGDFVGFVGDTTSRWLVREAVGAFRAAAAFPSEGAALPGWIEGVGWSDQWSFWQSGYPGVMVTDTAPFRNPHYHTTEDRPETLDYERMARVVLGLEAVVRKLVE